MKQIVNISTLIWVFFATFVRHVVATDQALQHAHHVKEVTDNVALVLRLDKQWMEDEGDNAVYFVYGSAAAFAEFEAYFVVHMNIGDANRWDAMQGAAFDMHATSAASHSKSSLSVLNAQSISNKAALTRLTALHEVTDRSRSVAAPIILLHWDAALEPLLPPEEVWTHADDGNDGSAKSVLSRSFGKRAKAELLRRWKAISTAEEEPADVAAAGAELNTAALVGRISRVLPLVLPSAADGDSALCAGLSSGKNSLLMKTKLEVMEAAASPRTAGPRTDELLDMATAAASVYVGLLGQLVIDGMLPQRSGADSRRKEASEALRELLKGKHLLTVAIVSVNAVVMLLLLLGLVAYLLVSQAPGGRRRKLKPAAVAPLNAAGQPTGEPSGQPAGQPNGEPSGQPEPVPTSVTVKDEASRALELSPEPAAPAKRRTSRKAAEDSEDNSSRVSKTRGRKKAAAPVEPLSQSQPGRKVAKMVSPADRLSRSQPDCSAAEDVPSAAPADSTSRPRRRRVVRDPFP